MLAAGEMGVNIPQIGNVRLDTDTLVDERVRRVAENTERAFHMVQQEMVRAPSFATLDDEPSTWGNDSDASTTWDTSTGLWEFALTSGSAVWSGGGTIGASGFFRVEPGSVTSDAVSVRQSSLYVLGPTLTLVQNLTHLSTLHLRFPSAVLGGFTLTNAATLYIQDAPSAATNNYGLFVDAGVARFDGDGTHVFEVPNDVGGVGATYGRIPINVTGVGTKYIEVFS